MAYLLYQRTHWTMTRAWKRRSLKAFIRGYRSGRGLGDLPQPSPGAQDIVGHHQRLILRQIAELEAQYRGDQLQQVVSPTDQGTVIAHPSTLADTERIRNVLPIRLPPTAAAAFGLCSNRRRTCHYNLLAIFLKAYPSGSGTAHIW